MRPIVLPFLMAATPLAARQTYFDGLEFANGGLRRSLAPSCSNTSNPQPNGPFLRQISTTFGQQLDTSPQPTPLEDDCGNVCATDAECKGCGTAGKCVYPPDRGFALIAASCVDVSGGAPTDTPHNASAPSTPGIL